MLYLDAEATRASLPMGDAIEAMEVAFSNESEIPLRTLIGGSLVMPGRVGDHTAVKVVSTVPGSPAGIVVVFGADGSPIGIVDGPTLTSIRTGAVCGLATRLLAPEEASVMAMLGAGAMAFDQIEAVRQVRPVRRVMIWSRQPGNATSLAERVGGEAIGDCNEAVAAADIVSCATPSRKPLFSSSVVSRSAHVNAVGAFTPEMVELPSGLLDSAFVVVDGYESAAVEAGDLIQAGREPDRSLTELLAGNTGPPSRPTVFKSVGVASQDVAAAQRAVENARETGLGVTL